MTYAQTYDHGSLSMNCMNAKAYMDNHRGDHAPSFAFTPHSTERIAERLQTQAMPRSIILVASESVLFVQLTPVNYTDRTGYSPWSEFWDGVGNWFGDHWVELAIGAGTIAVGVITMGVGVSRKAILDAVRHPLKTVVQAGGIIKYYGRYAVVVLNSAGEVVTTWATSHLGWRQ